MGRKHKKNKAYQTYQQSRRNIGLEHYVTFFLVILTSAIAYRAFNKDHIKKPVKLVESTSRNRLELDSLFQPPLTDDVLHKNKYALEKITNDMNGILETALHGGILKDLYNITRFSFRDEQRDTVAARISQDGTGLAIELSASSRKLSIQHELIHAKCGSNGQRFFDHGCRTDENSYSRQIAWAAPFYPYNRDELEHYVGLIQTGMNKLFNTLDLLLLKENPTQKEIRWIQHTKKITADYTPKVFMLPLVKADFPELSDPKNLAKLEQGGELKIDIPINSDHNSLINNGDRGDIGFPLLIQSITTSNSFFIAQGVLSHDPTTAYLFDTLATDELINARQRSDDVIHVTELVAHLMEAQTMQTYKTFFPELKNYHDKLNSVNCPAPRTPR